MDYKYELDHIGENAKRAFKPLSIAPTDEKNSCLASIASRLIDDKGTILEANKIDIHNGEQNNLNDALLDRLKLTSDRLEDIAKGVEEIIQLDDPVGKMDNEFKLYNNLVVKKVRVALGVIGIIYESRPNVTVDAAALCLKAGNAVILRGGSESIHSNKALAQSMASAIQESNFSRFSVQLLPWTDREAVSRLLKLNEYIDLIIPRGGEGLIKFVAENATVPVVKHYKGVCHIFIDKDADTDMALSIVENAKCQRPGVCNAVETVLIHKKIADNLVSPLAQCLTLKDVELRGDERFCAYIPSARLATENDWYEEYLDKILSIRIVDNIDEAIAHIATYGSAHSDAIISENQDACDKFLHEVDSAVVYVNASTRFTDGGQFGMGAEIGISTDRIHARGPMGINELTTYKFNVIGTGQIRK